jgi:hypothetical protein
MKMTTNRTDFFSITFRISRSFYLGRFAPCYTAGLMEECSGRLHPNAIKGLQLFNQGRFFEAHEELETAWRGETGAIRDLYRGMLQIAVIYLHIQRGNYSGAIKVHDRCRKWIQPWPVICKGIRVEKMRRDLEAVIKEIQRLGTDRIFEFDPSLFSPVEWTSPRVWTCDRCGGEMTEHNCKIICLACGNRFDCSDLNLHFD